MSEIPEEIKDLILEVTKQQYQIREITNGTVI